MHIIVTDINDLNLHSDLLVIAEMRKVCLFVHLCELCEIKFYLLQIILSAIRPLAAIIVVRFLERFDPISNRIRSNRPILSQITLKFLIISKNTSHMKHTSAKHQYQLYNQGIPPIPRNRKISKMLLYSNIRRI